MVTHHRQTHIFLTPYAFSSIPPILQGHIVSIERLSSDLLSTTHVNVSGFFPDDYVESPSLFKRKGVYYVTYGSCCCGCAEGGGIVIFTAPSVHGPWTRQVSGRENETTRAYLLRVVCVSCTCMCVCVLCAGCIYTPYDGTLIPIGIPPSFSCTYTSTRHRTVTLTVSTRVPRCVGGLGDDPNKSRS